MAWINTNERLPDFDQPVLCRLKHCFSGNIQEHRLIRVDEDDCNWRTGDDHCEVDFSWDVIAWEDPSASHRHG